MPQTQSEKSEQISIKDRLKDRLRRVSNSRVAVACVRAPRGLYVSLGTSAVVAIALLMASFAVSKIASYEEFEKIALATPTAASRLIRQHEVAHFGNRVSTAFGIEGEVATEFADWILEASERQRLTPELLASLVVTESSFRKIARSHVGAIGPTQVRPDYWGEFCGQPDLHDPEQNVYCGAQVLSHLMERCEGDQACGLAAYNVGPYAQRAGAANRYVKKIDRYMTSLEERAL
jgi:soluble lytic murein transglycosylase-like protein